MTTIQQIEQTLRERSTTQTVPHLSYLYRYAADALHGALTRPGPDRSRDIGSVARGLGLAVRGSPEAKDIEDVPMTLTMLSEEA